MLVKANIISETTDLVTVKVDGIKKIIKGTILSDAIGLACQTVLDKFEDYEDEITVEFYRDGELVKSEDL